MISIGGKRISNTGLIIKPFQHIYLDRYFDQNKKFLFSIIETTTENSRKAAYLGNIKIQLFKQKQTDQYYSTHTVQWNGWPNEYTFTNPFINSQYSLLDSHPKTVTTTNSNINFTKSKPCYKSFDSVDTDIMHNDDNYVQSGIIQGGSKSNTDFTMTNIDVYNIPTVTYEYQLLPMSHKTSDDLRYYCPVCGRRIKSAQNYCPRCGNKN